MTAEEERTRLIGDIARVLRDGPVPDDARAAALTFIGWLARRMPGEPVSRCDLHLCKGANIPTPVPSAPGYDPSCGPDSADSAKGAPPAGKWFPAYLFNLIDRAQPPL